jgi:uncharacterized protein (DUF952 family)
MQIVYKILSEPEWRMAVAAGVFAGSAADLRDGFIHLSTARQLPGTAAKHFAGQTDLLLIAFREGDLAGLRWEPSRGGDLFPHVYGEIRPQLAVSVQQLPFANGAHHFPEGLS